MGVDVTSKSEDWEEDVQPLVYIEQKKVVDGTFGKRLKCRLRVLGSNVS